MQDLFIDESASNKKTPSVHPINNRCAAQVQPVDVSRVQSSIPKSLNLYPIHVMIKQLCLKVFFFYYHLHP